MELDAVYPRVCGGTRVIQFPRRPGPGLSPRVRGNRYAIACVRRALRSIPACAGEPELKAVGLSLGEVYPRVCGGTPLVEMPLTAALGLSPRVRGNRQRLEQRPGDRRSIPACAGEPRR